MLINTAKCIGCFTCSTACARRNDLLASESFIRYEFREAGTYPKVAFEAIPVQCMHCTDAPCVTVCPTGAAHFGTDGIVQVDKGRCIGCKYCMAACPYQVRAYNEQTGAVDKCRLCAIQDLQTGAQTNTCVSACPTQARIVGDLDDPDSEISKAIAAGNAVPLIEGLTNPSVFYVR